MAKEMIDLKTNGAGVKISSKKLSFTGALILLVLLSFQLSFAQSSGTSRQPEDKPDAATLNISARGKTQTVDASVPNDPTVDSAISVYRAKVAELGAPIGKLQGDLKKSGVGGGSLGNFVADAMRKQAGQLLGKPIQLAVVNAGGLRKNSITAGNLTTTDIYELLPFENALVTLDLTGEQLLRFLEVVVARRDAQSGARIVYRNNPETKSNEPVSVRLGDTDARAESIDPARTYTLVTIDYLVNRGGDYSILKEAGNIKPLGLTIRDALIDYVKAETSAGRAIKSALDGRFRYERAERRES